MKATLTGFDVEGKITHRDSREYPDLSLVWEHIGAQQNNRRTVSVVVETDQGQTYAVKFSPWTPQRRYAPSRRFAALLEQWTQECALAE